MLLHTLPRQEVGSGYSHHSAAEHAVSVHRARGEPFAGAQPWVLAHVVHRQEWEWGPWGRTFPLDHHLMNLTFPSPVNK